MSARRRVRHARLPLLALLLVAGAAAQAAGPLRLVLDSGWIVPVSGDGQQFAGEAHKLDLPPDSGRIARFSIDAAQRRLYVTPQLPYGRRGTAVFDLATLKRLGFMPGVAQVTVPVDATAPWLVTHSYVSRDASPGDNLSVEQLRFEHADAQTVELRARRDWNTTGASVRDVPLSFGATTLWPCYAKAQKAFIEPAGLGVVGDDLKPRAVARPAGSAPPAQSGVAAACWPGGERLLVNWSDERSDQSGFLARAGGTGKAVARVDAKSPLRLRSERADVFALGRDARYGLYTRGNDEFVAFDFERNSARRLNVVGNAAFAQFSSDRSALYLVSAYYEFRGATDTLYIDGMYGGADYGDQVYRIRVDDDGVRSEKLELPQALREINDRAAQLSQIDALDDTPEEYKQEMRERIAPLGPLGQKLGTFAIVGVIAD